MGVVKTPCSWVLARIFSHFTSLFLSHLWHTYHSAFSHSPDLFLFPTSAFLGSLFLYLDMFCLMTSFSLSAPFKWQLSQRTHSWRLSWVVPTLLSSRVGSTNYGPKVKSGGPPAFVNKVLLEHSHADYSSSVVALTLQWERDRMASKVENIYYLALSRRCLLLFHRLITVYNYFLHYPCIIIVTQSCESRYVGSCLFYPQHWVHCLAQRLDTLLRLSRDHYSSSQDGNVFVPEWFHWRLLIFFCCSFGGFRVCIPNWNVSPQRPVAIFVLLWTL